MKLWGEVIMATSFILNLCPSRSIRYSCPEYAWSKQALGIEEPEIPYKRLKIIGCLAYSISPGHRNKIAPRSVKTIMVGYERNSNAYRLWDPASNRVIVSNNVVFNEHSFPLRDIDKTATEELTILNDESWDEAWESTVTNQNTVNKNTHHETTLENNEPAHQAPDPAPRNPSRRSNRDRQAVEHFGNMIGYHAVSELNQNPISSHDDGPENDEPSHSAAIKGPNRKDWFSAMSDEFSSLQLHNVGKLVEPPPGANILPGMWRLKGKRDEFGKIIKYKARWVAGGNHQIKGATSTRLMPPLA